MNKDDRLFISYSRLNQEVVKQIVEQLEARGKHVFIDYRDIKPGTIFAEEIVNAIISSVCCILVLSEESNKSSMVLNEINSASNHEKTIIPLRLDASFPLSKAMEFYIGKNNWFLYRNEETIDDLINAINRITEEKRAREIKFKGPVILNDEGLRSIGYDTEKKVKETIEIDYRALNVERDYCIDETIEGCPSDWMEYASNYPDTSSFLVVNDTIVGYYQLEFISEDNYAKIMNGSTIVSPEMEEFYGFGGDFFCYIDIMVILKEFETQRNSIMLMEDFFKRVVDIHNESSVNIAAIGISVYSSTLETMVKLLGFNFVTMNPAGGKVYQLSADTILRSSLLKKKYPAFVEIFQ